MSTIFPRFIDELEARVRIEEVLLTFCRGIDRKDWALLLSAFHPDATDDHGWVKGRVDKNLVPALKARHAGVTHAAHYLTNVAIRFVSADEAAVESYVWVVQREPDSETGGEKRTLAAVRYADVFRRRSGTWRIAGRTLVYGDMIPLVSDEPFRLPATFVSQSRDGSDPVELQEKALGLAPRPTP